MKLKTRQRIARRTERWQAREAEYRRQLGLGDSDPFPANLGMTQDRHISPPS